MYTHVKEGNIGKAVAEPLNNLLLHQVVTDRVISHDRANHNLSRLFNIKNDILNNAAKLQKDNKNNEDLLQAIYKCSSGTEKTVNIEFSEKLKQTIIKKARSIQLDAIDTIPSQDILDDIAKTIYNNHKKILVKRQTMPDDGRSTV